MSRQGRKVYVQQSTGRRIIEQSRVRLLCVALFFMLSFSSICVRMIEVAVIRNPKAMTITVSDTDDEQSSEQIALQSSEPFLQRGDIVDRNGTLLATSLMTASIYANPKEIKDPETTAAKLAGILGMDEAPILSRLKSGKSFVWIKRNLMPKEQQAINSLGIPGLYFNSEEKRIYPYGNLFAHALGYVGSDNTGQAGLEKQFDQRLKDDSLNNEPLAVSLDVRVQSIMHEELKRTMEYFEAIGAVGIVMDMQSGELMSMVSLPDFNPQKPGKATDSQMFNRASFGAYEMGSTFKTFTLAMALDSNKATMQSSFDATNPLKMGNSLIRDAHPEHRWLSVPEIYAFSSNIGAARIALDVGGKHQRAFLEKIGMLQPLDIELPERAKPQYPSDWKEINTVTIAYGHGISVSPLHLVRGIAAMTNGGILPHLTLIKDGNANRAEGERVIAEQTSKNVRRLMRLVVDYGTGGKADVPGYHVGGKTGTAEKIRSNGTYDEKAKLTSFVSVFPIDHPKYLVLVMVDEPKENRALSKFATGGWAAAPVVGNVISRMGPLLGVKPQTEMAEDDAAKFWPAQPKAKKEAIKEPIIAETGDTLYHEAAY